MAIIIGTNSWATIAEADEYLTTRVGSQEWFALNDAPQNPGEESKESWLVTAYNYLLNNYGYSIPYDSTDQNVKNAQSEFAYFLSGNHEEFTEAANFIAMGGTEFKASKWSEKYSADLNGQVNLPILVQNFLKEYDVQNQTLTVEVE